MKYVCNCGKEDVVRLPCFRATVGAVVPYLLPYFRVVVGDKHFFDTLKTIFGALTFTPSLFCAHYRAATEDALSLEMVCLLVNFGGTKAVAPCHFLGANIMRAFVKISVQLTWPHLLD